MASFSAISVAWGIVLHMLATFVALIIIGILSKEGLGGLLKRTIGVLRLVPGVNGVISAILKREVGSFVKQIESSSTEDEKKTGAETKVLAIPEKGIPIDTLRTELQKLKSRDVDPSSGRVFAYVYTQDTSAFSFAKEACDIFDCDSNLPEVKEAVVKEFFNAFLHENALNPMVFPSLLKFETEVVAMTANMLHGDSKVVGSLTSGGTESILMAVKTYRDRARALFPNIKKPEMVAPATIHPAFGKASKYFDVKLVHVPLDSDMRPNMVAYKKAITPNTILLLGSAPQYPHGIVDPIEEISTIALEMGLPFHVDSCIGGFMLPWVEKLGYDVPVFDFRLSGVTSMSADIHKYGLGIKGASVVMYRNDQIRKYQIFAYSDWPGGLFGSIGMAGTRPGGTIAASWAALMAVGQDGYMNVAKDLMEVMVYMKAEIGKIEGLRIVGNPHMTIFAFESTEKEVDINAVADVMERTGWKMERQSTSIHCTMLPHHTMDKCRQLVNDLRDAVDTVRANPALAKTGTAAMYGMVGKIPDEGLIADFVVEFFNSVYQLK
jgi:sphinganine-1-phosphate aldolase